MEKDLLGGKIGEIAKYDVSFKDGKLIAALEMDAIDLAIEGLKMVKEKIPGHFDDMLIDSAIPLLEKLKQA